MKRALLILAAVVLVGFMAAPASATTIDDVAQSLRSDPVYNDPKAELKLTTAQADQLSAQIRDGDKPVFIAVLPAAARGSRTTDDVVATLQSRVGLSGTYAAVVGNQFRATNSAAADSAYQSEASNGVYAVLSQFVDNVQTGTSSGSDADGSLLGPVLVFGTLAAGAGGLIYAGRRRQKKADAAALAEVRETLDEDITAFGESLDSVDADALVTDEDRADWLAAIDQYDKAKKTAEAMTGTLQAATVTEALDEGRYRVACVQARLAGEPVPERRPPCFFDPRHGLSVQDVAYTPSGTYQQRDVPACAACAATIADGHDPDPRLVPTSRGRAPYWQAGPQYGGYASGYYERSGMDLFSTIMIGTMIGNMMSGGYHGGYHDYGSSGDGGGFGGGDFGNFGGGDFGGGDFGGGGGGDFGSW